MSGDSDAVTGNWQNRIKKLHEIISSNVTKNELREKVVSIAISIDAHDTLKLFKWMLDTLCAPSNAASDLQEVLFELIPSITSRDKEAILMQSLKSYVERQDSTGAKIVILSITRMLHSAQGRFQPLPVIRFLSWCTGICDEGECVNEMMKLSLSYMAQLENEADVLHELRVMRSIWSTDDVETHPSIPGPRGIIPATIFSLQFDSIRTAYQSLLVATEPNLYNGLDAIVYLVLFHHGEDTRDELLKILHQDSVVETDHRCNEKNIPPKEVDGAKHILPLVIKTLKEIDVSSFEMKVQSTLLQAATYLGLHLLHSPIHHPNYPALDSFEIEMEMRLPIQWIMVMTKKYISDLFGILPSENKEQMVSAMLSLSDTNLEMTEKNEKTFWSAEEELMESIPLSLRKMIRVGNNSDESNQVQRRHWQDVWASSSIILIDLVRRYRIVFGMEIILGRLEQNGCQWFSGRKNSKACSRMIRKDFEYTMAELNCIALVAYAENVDFEQEINDIDPIDLMEIVQRMLLSFFDADTSKRSSMAGRNGNAVLGMILSKYFVRSTVSSDEDRSTVAGWATRIIMNQEDSDRVHMDAVLGYFGLYFLCSLCPEVDTSSLFSSRCTLIDIDIVKEKEKVCVLSVQDVFDRVKLLVLSRIGMVQSESTLMANDTGSVIGYTKVPRYFQATEKAKKRRVFCVASFLRRIGLNGIHSTADIQEWFRFARCLTGVYLQFASFVSEKRWTADCWVLASVELLPYNDSIVELSPDYRFVDGMGETSLEMENLDEVGGTSVNAFFQSAHTFVIAISIKHAILMNGYRVWKNTAKATKAELLMQLIQYQLAKLYDLNHHFHRIMELILDVNDQGSDDSNVTAEVKDLKIFVSSLFHSVTFIPPCLLLDTLQSMSNHSLTKEWDIAIRSVLTQRSSSTLLETSLRSLLECLTLESCTSLHLNTIVKRRKRILEQCGAGEIKIHADLCVMPLEVKNLLAAFHFLKIRMLWLPLCKRFYMSDHYLSGSMILRDPMVVRNIADHVRNVIVLHLELINHTIHENLCVDKRADFVISLLAAESKKNVRAADLAKPQTSPLYQLMKCIMITDDSIVASHMLDLVSHIPQKKHNASDWIQKVTWTFVTGLDVDKRIEPPEAQILYNLPLPFVQCICDYLDPNASPQDPVNRSLINLVRVATKRMVNYDDAIDLSHIILTHWSHAIAQGVSHISCRYFDQLVDTIDVMLRRNSEMFKSSLSSKRSLSVKEGAGILLKIDLSSVPSIYDFVLHLVVVTMAILGQSTVIFQKSNALYHGIGQVLAVLKTFGKMMNMYVHCSHCFPKSTMQSVANSCVLVMKHCEEIATKYSEVEIADTLPRKRASTISPLKDLIDGMKEYCCGSVSRVCNIDSSHDGKSLLAKSEKMQQFLFTIESSCNLIPSSLMALPNNVRKDKKRQSNVAMDRNPKKSKVKVVRLGDDILATSQVDDDSFGVDGDWGDDSSSNGKDGNLHVGLSVQL